LPVISLYPIQADTLSIIFGLPIHFCCRNTSRLNCFEKIDSETKKRRFIECVKKCLDIVYHFVCEDDFDSLFIIYNSICLDTDSHNNVDFLSGSNLNTREVS